MPIPQIHCASFEIYSLSMPVGTAAAFREQIGVSIRLGDHAVRSSASRGRPSAPAGVAACCYADCMPAAFPGSEGEARAVQEPRGSAAGGYICLSGAPSRLPSARTRLRRPGVRKAASTRREPAEPAHTMASPLPPGTGLCAIPAAAPPAGTAPPLTPAMITVSALMTAWSTVFTVGRLYNNARKLRIADCRCECRCKRTG